MNGVDTNLIFMKLCMNVMSLDTYSPCCMFLCDQQYECYYCVVSKIAETLSPLNVVSVKFFSFLRKFENNHTVAV
jgi:hypothetical protein